jgi:hypothetical protein
MVAEIAKELLNRIEDTEKSNPNERIPIIITFEPNFSLDVSTFEREGLDVKYSFPEINAVSGTITAADAKKVAKQKGVKVIEYDSKVYAL